MGDDEVRRGPPGAERDPYRAPDGYEHDYAPPRGFEWVVPLGNRRPGTLPRAPGPNQGGDGGGGGNRVTNFPIAGAFIGMGAGVAFDTSVDLEPSNVASREILDRQTPSWRFAWPTARPPWCSTSACSRL